MMASGIAFFWYFDIMVLALNILDCVWFMLFDSLFYDFFFLK